MGTSGEETKAVDERQAARTEIEVDPRATTVHDAVGSIPGARAVFERFGIDTCCGGELPLTEAAEMHDVELRRLLDALEDAVEGD